MLKYVVTHHIRKIGYQNAVAVTAASV